MAPYDECQLWNHNNRVCCSVVPIMTSSSRRLSNHRYPCRPRHSLQCYRPDPPNQRASAAEVSMQNMYEYVRTTHSFPELVVICNGVHAPQYSWKRIPVDDIPNRVYLLVCWLVRCCSFLGSNNDFDAFAMMISNKLNDLGERGVFYTYPSVNP